MLPQVHRIDSARPGPHVVVFGGIHGDEDEGILVAQRLLARLPDEILTGRMTVVPIANPPAAITYTRTSPLDGQNLARVFPGSHQGTPTERIAAFLTDLIDEADLLVDLHSAGAKYQLLPYCGYVASDDDVGRRAREAAEAFGSEVIWAHPAPASPGRSTFVASEKGVPAIYAEAPGGGVLTESIVSEYELGVLRVLGSLGVTAAVPPQASKWRAIGSGDMDNGVQAGAAGRFVGAAELGADVHAGAILGRVLTEQGEEAAIVRAPQDGRLILLRREPRVRADELVALLAQPTEP